MRGYFAALARSDAPAALAFGRLPAGPHDLLTSQVLAEQQHIAPMRDVQIGSVTRFGGARNGAVLVPAAFRTREPHGHLARSRSPTAARAGGWPRPRWPPRSTSTRRSTAARSPAQPSRTAARCCSPGALPVRFDTTVPAARSRPPAQVRLGGRAHVTLGVRADRRGPGASRGSGSQAADRVRVRTAAEPACPLPSTGIVPGSLHGQLVGTVAHDLKFTVSSDAAGSIEATGSVAFRGTLPPADLRQHRPDPPRRGAPAGPCVGLRRRVR